LINTAKTIRIPAYMVELLSKWAGQHAAGRRARPHAHAEEIAASSASPQEAADHQEGDSASTTSPADDQTEAAGLGAECS